MSWKFDTWNTERSSSTSHRLHDSIFLIKRTLHNDHFEKNQQSFLVKDICPINLVGHGLMKMRSEKVAVSVLIYVILIIDVVLRFSLYLHSVFTNCDWIAMRWSFTCALLQQEKKDFTALKCFIDSLAIELSFTRIKFAFIVRWYQQLSR